ncbi:hypothetical protein LEP1GSC168_0857 [Leptospira santarosai str. HAI134]|nr:hypothetical protein LEP1GSC168_0857 [Leptospira santarosai str. HAI134]
MGEFAKDEGFENAVIQEWWTVSEYAGVKIHFLPAKHWSRMGLTDMNQYHWGSYAFEFENIRIYFGGDPGFQNTSPKSGNGSHKVLPPPYCRSELLTGWLWNPLISDRRHWKQRSSPFVCFFRFICSREAALYLKRLHSEKRIRLFRSRFGP